MRACTEEEPTLRGAISTALGTDGPGRTPETRDSVTARAGIDLVGDARGCLGEPTETGGGASESTAQQVMYFILTICSEETKKNTTSRMAPMTARYSRREGSRWCSRSTSCSRTSTDGSLYSPT